MAANGQGIKEVRFLGIKKIVLLLIVIFSLLVVFIVHLTALKILFLLIFMLAVCAFLPMKRKGRNTSVLGDEKANGNNTPKRYDPVRQEKLKAIPNKLFMFAAEID